MSAPADLERIRTAIGGDRARFGRVGKVLEEPAAQGLARGGTIAAAATGAGAGGATAAAAAAGAAAAGAAAAPAAAAATSIPRNASATTRSCGDGCGGSSGAAPTAPPAPSAAAPPTRPHRRAPHRVPRPCSRRALHLVVAAQVEIESGR
jgi:hypothetical protein